MKKRILIFAFLLPLLAIPYACKDDGNYYKIPNYTVYFDIQLDSYDMDFSIGSCKTFSNRGSVGYMGVIVYRFTADEFYAYDMACPNDFIHGCAIEFNRDAGMFQCTKCCQVKFNILNGSPEKNPDYKTSLRQYKVEKINSNTFRVTN